MRKTNKLKKKQKTSLRNTAIKNKQKDMEKNNKINFVF